MSGLSCEVFCSLPRRSNSGSLSGLRQREVCCLSSARQLSRPTPSTSDLTRGVVTNSRGRIDPGMLRDNAGMLRGGALVGGKEAVVSRRKRVLCRMCRESRILPHYQRPQISSRRQRACPRSSSLLPFADDPAANSGYSSPARTA